MIYGADGDIRPYNLLQLNHGRPFYRILVSMRLSLPACTVFFKMCLYIVAYTEIYIATKCHYMR